jgi:hypothetical protein
MTERRSRNKFANLLDVAEDARATPQERAVGEQRPPAHIHEPTQAIDDLPATRQRGRPATGKRSDPNFEQVTVYLRRQTHLDIKRALLGRDDRLDFSDLVEELLQEWLVSQS